MGNQKSAQVDISIDNSTITPGSVITGKVYLAVLKERIDADCLLLRFTGGEYSTIFINGGEGRSTTLHESVMFLDVTHTLAKAQDGYFVEGHYEFPFSLSLPRGVLPSMTVREDRRPEGCSVNYIIEAKLHRRGFFSWDVQKRKEFIVTTETDIPNYSTYIPPVEVPLDYMKFWQSGNIRLGMLMEKSVVPKDEKFDIHYVIQNNSTVRIRSLKVKVKEVITWRAQGRSRTLVNELVYRKLKRPAFGEIEPFEEENNAGPGIDDPEILHHLETVLQSKKYRCPIQIVDSAHVTMPGNLITVEHFLSIKLQTPFGSKNPKLKSKIIIHHKKQPISYAIAKGYIQKPGQLSAELPRSWRPIIQPLIDISVLQYTPPRIFHTQEFIHNPDAEAPPLIVEHEGPNNLFLAMQQTYAPSVEFQKWCEYPQNSADDLSPQDLQIVYQLAIKIPEQIAITDLLLQFRTYLTCSHIASILAAAHDEAKIWIVRKLAVKITDKENIGIIRDCLTTFQYVCVDEALVTKE